LSFEIAIKNKPPEVVKLRSKNFTGGSGADGAYRSNERNEHGCAYHMPLHGCPPKQIKGGAVNDTGCSCSLRSEHYVSDTESTGNTASHSRHPRAPKQRRRHNDQEYDIIYYLQGGDMWHIT